MTLRDILGVLRDAYCRRVGVEYMHITDPEERVWLQQRIEVKHDLVDREEQKHVLGRLNAAEAFETFLQTKYVGQRRFSLEGAESVIPLLDAVLTEAAGQELDEVVIGMPHRGRLNVLANIVGKSYGKIFAEFEGNIDPRSSARLRRREVPPRLERHVQRAAPARRSRSSLTANPSHLEAVDPVRRGHRAGQAGPASTRARPASPCCRCCMHGDAAFAGQGVVAETLNLSQLRGYRTGGTVHVVVNNQVGFTTSPAAARSSIYSTDVARMIQAPIFHVNGDDPEACVRVAKLAVDYRREFKKDVVIDMVCYRRRGHNETDNPSFTQPLMYDIIDKKRSVRKLYTEALIGRGDITLEEAEEALRDFQEQLERVFVETRDATGQARPAPDMTPPAPRAGRHRDHARDDEADRRRFRRAARTASRCTRGSSRSWTGAVRWRPRAHVDWAFGELLAFGSTVLDGVPVRLAGQDSRRGTFSQRHSVLIDRNTGEEHTPLKYLDEDQAQFWVYDSLLSEFAAVGFEYGYSVANPDALVCWEAQFGDFVDGAQTIIDEFISSGEAKWGQRSRVTLLLPHGYEGQGPDHSSRPDRALPADVRRGQHHGRQLHHPGELLPPAAPAGAGRRPPAGRVHPEVAAAAAGGDLGGGGVHRRPVPAGAARPGRAAGVRGGEGAGLLGQDLLRPRAVPGPARDPRHRGAAAGAAAPVPGRVAGRGARGVPVGGGALGAGGAGEHGRLDVRGLPAAGAARRPADADRTGPPGVGLAGRRARARRTRTQQRGRRRGGVRGLTAG